jgi:hypothetical protein
MTKASRLKAVMRATRISVFPTRLTPYGLSGNGEGRLLVGFRAPANKKELR